MIFILYYGSYKVITTRGLDLNIGQISSLITYGTQILGSLMRLSMVLVIITLARESAVRIVEVLEEGEKPALTSPVNGIKEISSGEIEFIDVNFIYNSARNQQNILHESMTGTQNLSHDNDSNSNKNISGSQNFSHESMTGTQKFSHDNDSNTQNSRLYALRNINLHIESGSTIGIIGGTGSSKTTLIQLIPRLYDVTSGVIKISGHDVKEYDLNSLRNNIALVLQKNELFTGTIRDNLLWGNENATDSQIIEVCKIAHADEFIEKLPAKYNTHIEQNGTNLSGGQKQRLCIARALLKQPKILILDDSTSAVDTHTDALIRSGLKNYLPNTTKIIISQRILSVQDADKIIVMDDGEIKAVGTHKDLLKSSAIYNEIYLSQTRKELL
ncbi:MAG: ABC transporter ATP-binding protein [Synergistaceae bacterium]|nr:ABC transporter ATP-binding protein [Synergistaceae bacterium]